jgi:uncharacterized phage-associated protein
MAAPAVFVGGGVAMAEQPTTTVTANDVAAELRRRQPGIGVTKLHKLLYYAQGWHLAWIGEPMFEDRIEAWANGPVVANLWADEKYRRPTPEPRPVEGNRFATLDYVVERYGHLTGQALAEQTHTEDPWLDLSRRDDAQAVPSAEITHEALRRWFRRDEELIAHEAEVERLREGPYSDLLAPLERTPELEAAIARALTGDRVRDQRPDAPT